MNADEIQKALHWMALDPDKPIRTTKRAINKYVDRCAAEVLDGVADTLYEMLRGDGSEWDDAVRQAMKIVNREAEELRGEVT